MKEGQKTISLAGGEILEVAEIVALLEEWGAKGFADFLIKKGVKMPRSNRMSILKEILRPGIVKTRNESLTLDSRLNYRLLWFNIFSEEQMVFFIDTFDTKYLARQYRLKLYEDIVLFLEETDIEILDDLVDEVRLVKQDEEVEKFTMKEFHNLFNDVYVDAEGELDGLTADEFRPIMFNSATVLQLSAIATKFGFEVPQSLKKDVLPSYITTVVKSTNPEADISMDMFDDAMTVKEMKAIAAQYGLEVGSNLNKKQTIEYILMNGETTKGSYKAPESDAVYEMAIPITEAESRYDELALERDVINTELMALQEKLESVVGAERAEVEKAIAEKEAALTARDEELAQAKADIEKVKLEKDQATESLDEALVEIDKLKIELAQTKREKEEAVEPLDQALIEINRLKEELEKAKAEDKGNGDLEGAVAEINRLKAELEKAKKESVVYVDKTKEKQSRVDSGEDLSSDRFSLVMDRLNRVEQLMLTKEPIVIPVGSSAEEKAPMSRAMKLGLFFAAVLGFGLCVFAVIMLALMLAGVV
ncbi:MAG TPA: hypothetical protein PKX91_05235 [Clostridia bacterium]|jgi:hypothetical protein|nr:hypothetical protein [Clostridia bacterium]